MNKSKRVSKIIRQKRIELGYSQPEVAKFLGMKNGQFISNIERNLCALPIKYVHSVGKALKINPEVLVSAMKEDFSDFVDDQLASQVKKFWGTWEDDKVVVVNRAEVKANTDKFVQDLRTKMDNENLNRFLRA